MIWDKEIKYTAPEREDLERTRDMFAGIAMQSLMDVKCKSIKQYTKTCYDLADAMIKEKQRRRNICNVDESK